MAILLIEDDRLMSVTLHDALTSEGYSVHAAATLQDAVTALRGSDFDLVITDVKLPDGDGFTIMTHAFQARAQVIVMTAYGDTKQKTHAMQSGAFAYVTKPFALKEFLGLVRKAIGALADNNSRGGESHLSA